MVSLRFYATYGRICNAYTIYKPFDLDFFCVISRVFWQLMDPNFILGLGGDGVGKKAPYIDAKMFGLRLISLEINKV